MRWACIVGASCAIILILATGLALGIYRLIAHHDRFKGPIAIYEPNDQKADKSATSSRLATQAETTTQGSPQIENLHVETRSPPTQNGRRDDHAFHFCGNQQSSCEKYGQPVSLALSPSGSYATWDF